MKKLLSRLSGFPALCVIWTAVCYTMGAGTWLSWWYRLASVIASSAADLISMVAGYVLQAAGIFVTTLVLRRGEGRKALRWALAFILLFALSTALSLLSQSLPSLLFWGLLMNFVDGVLAGFYLDAIFICSDQNQHGLLFGCGYALLTPLMYGLALLRNGAFFHPSSALWFYLGMSVLAAGLACPLFAGKRPGLPDVGTEAPAVDNASEADADSPSSAVERSVRVCRHLPQNERQVWMLSLTVLFLFSIVKNLGFSFPSTDVVSGINVEFSRLFYGAGLVAAGLIYARSPKTASICALASLAISFVMLAMEEEPVLRVVFWGLDYFFFAFVSVYRIALPMELARVSAAQALPGALMGLIVGRFGDAIGTLLCVSLSAHRLWLILLTLTLFILAVFLFLRQYLLLYAPQQQRERSEREVFADFAIQHDLSDREKEVFQLLLAGRANGEIAEALFVSESTVKFHVHNLLQKTGCKTRRELTDKFQMLLYPRITKGPSVQTSRTA